MRLTAILKFMAKLLLKTSVQNSGLGFRSWAWAKEIVFDISLASAGENFRHSFYFMSPSKKDTKSISETYNHNMRIYFKGKSIRKQRKAYGSKEINLQYDLQDLRQ